MTVAWERLEIPGGDEKGEPLTVVVDRSSTGVTRVRRIYGGEWDSSIEGFRRNAHGLPFEGHISWPTLRAQPWDNTQYEYCRSIHEEVGDLADPGYLVTADELDDLAAEDEEVWENLHDWWLGTVALWLDYTDGLGQDVDVSLDTLVRQAFR